jgi:Family of unknown function (DUF5988)
MMEHVMTAAPGADLIRAVLEGGPNSIPVASRTQMVSPREEKIKLPHYGGYEHFERAGGADENVPSRPAVFRWTMRTKVAE